MRLLVQEINKALRGLASSGDRLTQLEVKSLIVNAVLAGPPKEELQQEELRKIGEGSEIVPLTPPPLT